MQLYVAAAAAGKTSRIVDTRPKVLVSSIYYFSALKAIFMQPEIFKATIVVKKIWQ